ncbi:MAG: hypothetical protein KBH21_00535 [Acetoanaerobium sp.]|nr:hypothetical protein [Acetoanaerobium sp.]
MKKSILIIFLLFSFFLSKAQVQFNEVDTTYIFTYNQLLAVRNNIEKTNYEIYKLQSTLYLLKEIDSEKTAIISKLKIRDSLYNKELEIYKNMDVILRDKLAKSNGIISNYKTLLLINEDELQVEIKQRKKESLWKNIYKFGYPALIVVAGVIIFK